MKKVAGRLRLDLAQYRELEAFAQFGSELDPQTQRTLARGERMVATLNQPQYQPWPLDEQVVAIFAGIQGLLDDIPPSQVRASRRSCASTCGRRARSRGHPRQRRGDLPDDAQAAARSQIEEFRKNFAVHEDAGLAAPA